MTESDWTQQVRLCLTAMAAHLVRLSELFHVGRENGWNLSIIPQRMHKPLMRIHAKLVLPEIVATLYGTRALDYVSKLPVAEQRALVESDYEVSVLSTGPTGLLERRNLRVSALTGPEILVAFECRAGVSRLRDENEQAAYLNKRAAEERHEQEEAQTRSVPVTVMVSEEDMRQLKAAARRAGLSLLDYTRRALLGVDAGPLHGEAKAG